MEVRDGFIVGIFNYCDRWCETCAFTSRCRLFADMARVEASQDPTLRPVVEASPRPEEEPAPPPPWMEELIEEANKEAASLTDEDLAKLRPKVAPEHEVIGERAMAYCVFVFKWLKDRESHTRDDPKDPLSVIAWFASLNASKIHRALIGLAEFDGDREFPPDHEGSAKVALLGIERSQAAWLQLVEQGRVSRADADRPIADLVWLGRQVEGAIPRARAFVRPGFDEPEAVAELT